LTNHDGPFFRSHANLSAIAAGAALSPSCA